MNRKVKYLLYSFVKGLTFRQKILLAYVVVLSFVISISYFIVERSANHLPKKQMINQAENLAVALSQAKDEEELVIILKKLRAHIFYRVGIITDERKTFYDSNIKRLFGDKHKYKDRVVHHPEVEEAFETGSGYREGYSQLFDIDFAYYALAFPFKEKIYILRLAFPLTYVNTLQRDFKLAILTATIFVLLLSSLMTGIIVHRLTNPIQRIISIIRPYQEGRLKYLPHIGGVFIDKDDEFGKLAYTLNDLSKKVQSHINSLTKERNEKKTILESLSEGVIAINDKLKVTYANGMAATFLRVKLQDLLGSNIEKYFANKGQFYLEIVKLLKQCLVENVVFAKTVEIEHNHQKEIYDLIISPIKDKKGSVLVLQDKSEQYKMIEMQKDFISCASHELKTPITIIHGFSETLHDNSELVPKMREEIIQKIMRNCERMGGLIDDLLLLCDEKEIPESRLEKCDLKKIVQDCSQIVLAKSEDAKITIKTEGGDPFVVEGDPRLIETALLNVIDNAAKYSRAELKKVDILITKTAKNVKVQISDKGLGIPKKEFENIFRRFYRLEKGKSKKLQGTGLGLSIVKMIIDKHGGKIKIQSKEGEGSSFIISFPVSHKKLL